MRRDISSWYSHRLKQDMPLVAYGHYGPPVLMLPTAAADFLEYERFHLIDSVSSYLENGQAKVYSINSVNRLALLNQNAAGWEKIEWLKLYDSYITEEVLPLIRADCKDDGVLPIVLGISLGAYLAANLFFRHPDKFGGAVLLSGSYDIRGYLNGYHNDDVYFNNPVKYLSRLDDSYHLPVLQNDGRSIIIFSGQGAFEAPDRSRELAGILSRKGIPHWLDIWGFDVNHDCPWWRKAVPHYFARLFG